MKSLINCVVVSAYVLFVSHVYAGQTNATGNVVNKNKIIQASSTEAAKIGGVTANSNVYDWINTYFGSIVINCTGGDTHPYEVVLSGFQPATSSKAYFTALSCKNPPETKSDKVVCTFSPRNTAYTTLTVSAICNFFANGGTYASFSRATVVKLPTHL